MERGYNDGGSRRFNFGHIIGDPFALATISISIVSSLIDGQRDARWGL